MKDCIYETVDALNRDLKYNNNFNPEQEFLGNYWLDRK